MNNQELKESYTVEVTQQIIDSSNVWDVLNCIGVNSLKSIEEFKDEFVYWGVSSGGVYIGDENHITFESFDKEGNVIPMTEITKPCTVVFKRVN